MESLESSSFPFVNEDLKVRVVDGKGSYKFPSGDKTYYGNFKDGQ